MERNYGNIGVLDIRTANEKVFEDQFKVGNIGVILYSKQTAPFLKYVNAGNIGTSIECDENVQIVQGKTQLSSESLAELKSPLRLVVMGKLVVQDNLSSEALSKGIDFLQVSGKVICPNDLLPTLQSKAKDLSGKIEIYPSGYQLIEKSLYFDKTQINSIKIGSKLAIFGDLSLDKDISPQELKERLAGLFIKGNLIVPESLLETIQSLLHPLSSCNFLIIPAGYETILEDVQISPTDLMLWKGAKVYFTGSIRFSPEINDADINQIEAFIAKKDVYCREDLLPALIKKCDRFKTRLIPYKDRLFFNEGQADITRSFLCDGAGLVTIVNQGMLSIDPSITIEEIRAKIHTVRNSGILSVTKIQMGAIQEKVKESDGQIVSSSTTDEQNSSGTGNIGILKL